MIGSGRGPNYRSKAFQGGSIIGWVGGCRWKPFFARRINRRIPIGAERADWAVLEVASIASQILMTELMGVRWSYLLQWFWALILTSARAGLECRIGDPARTGVFFPSLHLDVNPGWQSRGTPKHQWNSCCREGMSPENQVAQDPSSKGTCYPK